MNLGATVSIKCKSQLRDNLDTKPVTLYNRGMRYRKLRIAWSVAWGAAAVLLVAGCGGPPSSATIAQLKSGIKPVIQQLEAYKAAHGEYPKYLSQAGIELPVAKYGGWRYATDGNTFGLAIGDYGRDEFELYWNSKVGDWYLDT
jgi:hypothetical protein